MNLKKWGIALVAGVGVLTLAACGNDPKETVIESSKTVYEAKQLEYSTKLSLEATVKGESLEQFVDKETLNALKNFSLTVDGKSDLKAQKDEAVIKANLKSDLLSFDFSLPIYSDLKAKKAYVEVEDIGSLSEMFLGSESAELKGKTLELDLTDESLGLKESDLNTSKIQAETNKVVFAALEKLPEASFSKEKDTYSVVFKDKDLKKLVEDLLANTSIVSGEFTKEEQEAFKKSLKELDLSGSKAVVSYTLDGKDIKSHKLVLDLKIPVEGETLGLKFTVDTTYKSINKPVKFDFDASKKDLITVSELEALISEQDSLYDDMYYDEEYDVEFEEETVN